MLKLTDDCLTGSVTIVSLGEKFSSKNPDISKCKLKLQSVTIRWNTSFRSFLFSQFQTTEKKGSGGKGIH